MTPEQWRQGGKTLEVPDGRVFWTEHGSEHGDAPALPVLVLHGFPTSSWDFCEVAQIVARRRRVVLFDFIGFGHSDKPHDAGYSLFEQADVVELVARAAGLRRAHVWAHDMGTSVATEVLARRERELLHFEPASIVLMNGSVHIEMARPTVGQKILLSPAGDLFARLGSRAVFFAQMKRIYGRPARDADLQGMWELLDRADGRRRLPAIIAYMRERVRFRRRWVGALERLDLPALVAWGEKDPVARLEIARQLEQEIAGSERARFAELGHYPQVEDAAQVASAVEAFWSKHDAAAPRA